MNRLHSSCDQKDRKEPGTPKERGGRSEGRRWREEVPTCTRNSTRNGPGAENNWCVQRTHFLGRVLLPHHSIEFVERLPCVWYCPRSYVG